MTRVKLETTWLAETTTDILAVLRVGIRHSKDVIVVHCEYSHAVLPIRALSEVDDAISEWTAKARICLEMVLDLASTLNNWESNEYPSEMLATMAADVNMAVRLTP